MDEDLPLFSDASPFEGADSGGLLLARSSDAFSVGVEGVDVDVLDTLNG